jgi:hypothetical protein
LELWTWRTGADAFEFGWTAGGEHRVAWLQVRFNRTSPRPAWEWRMHGVGRVRFQTSSRRKKREESRGSVIGSF